MNCWWRLSSRDHEIVVAQNSQLSKGLKNPVQRSKNVNVNVSGAASGFSVFAEQGKPKIVRVREKP
jgi:hypothetical protein